MLTLFLGHPPLDSISKEMVCTGLASDGLHLPFLAGCTSCKHGSKSVLMLFLSFMASNKNIRIALLDQSEVHPVQDSVSNSC